MILHDGPWNSYKENGELAKSSEWAKYKFKGDCVSEDNIMILFRCIQPICSSRYKTSCVYLKTGLWRLVPHASDPGLKIN